MLIKELNNELEAPSTENQELRDLISKQSSLIDSLNTTLAQKPPALTHLQTELSTRSDVLMTQNYAIFSTDQDLGSLSKTVDLVRQKRTRAIGERFFRNYYLLHHRGLIKITQEDQDKRLDTRQQEILSPSSVQHQLIPGTGDDIHEYQRQLSAFFKDTENLQNH